MRDTVDKGEYLYFTELIFKCRFFYHIALDVPAASLRLNPMFVVRIDHIRLT